MMKANDQSRIVHRKREHYFLLSLSSIIIESHEAAN